MNKKILAILIIIFVLGMIWIVRLNQENQSKQAANEIEFLAVENSDKFEKAIEVREFSFPEDYGAHNEFLTEWWYYTGNLQTTEGRHFGYQLTFFRRAISGEQDQTLASNWSTNQIYLAHFAITDTENNTHYVDDQIARNANDLAGTKVNPYFSVWLKNWEVKQIDDNNFLMAAEADNFEINLQLEKQRQEILHGDQGLSQKGPEVGNASYYYSLTRLATEGSVRIGEDWFSVSGLSWMDHEFGTSTLGSNQVGWDWFSMQFDNQTEMMLSQIREEDGTISEFSSGTFVTAESKTTNLSFEDFEIQAVGTWKNPDGFEYPSGWIVKVDQLEIDLKITPVVEDQEMDLFFQYWEGAVFIEGTLNGESIAGYGYVELTGYAQSMQGVF